MYAMLSPTFCLRTRTNSTGDKMYLLIEENETETVIPQTMYEVLKGADGTRPLKEGLENNELRFLFDNGILTKKRFGRDGIFNHFTLFPVGHKAARLRPAAVVMNTVLPFLAPLVFVIGMAVSPAESFYTLSFPLFVVLHIISLVLHELGHFNALTAYGQTVTDVGVLLLLVFPVGAYVSPRYTNRKLSWKRNTQVALSGVEMNLLFAGVLLIISCFSEEYCATLRCAADLNCILLVMNLIPAFGLDGMRAIESVLEEDCLLFMAYEVIFVRSIRRRVLRAGLPGIVLLGISFVTLAAHVLLPLYEIAMIVYLIVS